MLGVGAIKVRSLPFQLFCATKVTQVYVKNGGLFFMRQRPRQQHVFQPQLLWIVKTKQEKGGKKVV